MNKFPKLPFTLNECRDGQATGDADLVAYLKDPAAFAYLERSSREIIEHLHPQTALSDQKQRELLLRLWPSVLTDALRKLKERSDEWDKDNPNIGTFFHPGSLGVDELGKLLEEFAEFEDVIYWISPRRYRDHIAHAFRVWIIGQGMLRSTESFGGSLFVADPEAGGISPEEWECMWAIAALCHDIGYPVSAVDWINRRASKALRGLGLVRVGDLRFEFSPQASAFQDGIIRLMSSKVVKGSCRALPVVPARDRPSDRYLTHLQNKYYLKFLKSFDRVEHGVVSALLVSKALVYFLESDFCQDERAPLTKEEARQFLIRREILRAMATHSCADIYHVRFDTLSFLLYVADEIQCWGRPTLAELHHQAGASAGARAEVRALNGSRVDVIVRAAEDGWDGGRMENELKSLEPLRRVLRLAVGTKEGLRNKYLRFAVVPKTGKGCQLVLTDGKLGEPEEVDVEGLQAAGS